MPSTEKTLYPNKRLEPVNIAQHFDSSINYLNWRYNTTSMADRILNCPRCSRMFSRRKMRKISHPAGIVLDVCDNCGGMWVDREEIDIVFRKVKQDKDSKTKDKKKAKHGRKEK